MLAVDVKLVLLLLAFTAALGIAYIMSIDRIKDSFLSIFPAVGARKGGVEPPPPLFLELSGKF